MPIHLAATRTPIGFVSALLVVALAGCATPPAPRTADGALAFAFADHDGQRHRLELPLSEAEAQRAREAFDRYDGARMFAQVGDRLRPLLDAEVAKLAGRFPDVEWIVEDDLALR